MGVLCISLDIDWAHDVVINDTLDILSEHNAIATLFVTHSTPTLDRMRENCHELGLHPNFNNLLNGNEDSASQVFERIHELVPEAKSVRSHSLVKSTRLSQMFGEAGLTHESNVLIHSLAGNTRPWKDSFNLIQVPIRWEDDIALFDDKMGEPVDGLNVHDVHVCDFHPIHIYLNSLTLEDYESTRSVHNSPDALLAMRRPAGTGGSRDRFLEILKQRVPADDRTISEICCLGDAV